MSKNRNRNKNNSQANNQQSNQNDPVGVQTADPQTQNFDPDVMHGDAAFGTGDAGVNFFDAENEVTTRDGEDATPENDGQPTDTPDEPATPPAEKDAAADDSTPAKPEKKIVEWKGRIVPHKCPKCGSVLLRDRSTKACIVTHTHNPVAYGSVSYQDREMKCLWCNENFIAREDL